MAKGEGFARSLPSEHEAQRAQDAKAMREAAEKRQAEEARVLQAFEKVLRTEEGKVVWKWLFDRCGYNKTTLMRTAGGDVAPLSTECLSAVRNVYLDARKMPNRETLMIAEMFAEFGDVKPQEKPKGEK